VTPHLPARAQLSSSRRYERPISRKGERRSVAGPRCVHCSRNELAQVRAVLASALLRRTVSRCVHKLQINSIDGVDFSSGSCRARAPNVTDQGCIVHASRVVEGVNDFHPIPFAKDHVVGEAFCSPAANDGKQQQWSGGVRWLGQAKPYPRALSCRPVG